MPAKKDAWEAESWDELKKLSTLGECLAALKAKETQRVAHKKYYLKRQLVLDLAKERGLDKEVDKELAEQETS